MENTLDQKVKSLPQQPGVYKFKDEEEQIIYIGKAKSLKNRVSSYFTGKHTSRKTLKLVSEIKDFDFVVVETEFDALLLENNLIKTHQPKYNILLKDDKSYPFICITNERYPRIFPTRKRNKKDRYFGPYANVRMMNALLELIKKLYTIRDCAYSLTEKNVEEGKFKLCLEYHIHNCKGPCEGLQTEEDYQKDVDQITNILKGDLSIPKNFFKEEMMKAAEEMAFEKAQVNKVKLELLTNFQEKSMVISNTIRDLEVCVLIGSDDEDVAYASFMKVVHGCITQTESVEVKRRLDESPEEVLAFVLMDYREKLQTAAPRVLVNMPIALELERTEISVPQIGDLKKLLDLAVKNALYYKQEKERAKQELQMKKNKNSPMLQLKADLNLQDLPRHIECFDNSNIQGTNPVASMVCFKDGKPSKKDYRHYKIKTVVGPDDFASMKEVVGRRYKRLLDEDAPLPQLIVIDGGKGQLSSACEALKELDLFGEIAIIGIAKRLEELYFPGDTQPLHLSKKSQSLILLQKLRNEAHRFAITFHRNLRSKNSLQSSLEEIKGVGAATIQTLLLNYRTVSKIEEASVAEMARLIGQKKAELVKAYLAEKEQGSD